MEGNIKNFGKSAESKVQNIDASTSSNRFINITPKAVIGDASVNAVEYHGPGKLLILESYISPNMLDLHVGSSMPIPEATLLHIEKEVDKICAALATFGIPKLKDGVTYKIESVAPCSSKGLFTTDANGFEHQSTFMPLAKSMKYINPAATASSLKALLLDQHLNAAKVHPKITAHLKSIPKMYWHKVNPATIQKRFFADGIPSYVIGPNRGLKLCHPIKHLPDVPLIVDINDFIDVGVERTPTQTTDEYDLDLDAPGAFEKFHLSPSKHSVPFELLIWNESKAVCALMECTSIIDVLQVRLLIAYRQLELIDHLVVHAQSVSKLCGSLVKDIKNYLNDFRESKRELSMENSSLHRTLQEVKAAVSRREERVFTEFLKENISSMPMMCYIEMCDRAHDKITNILPILEDMEKKLVIRDPIKLASWHESFKALPALEKDDLSIMKTALTKWDTKRGMGSNILNNRSEYIVN